MFVLSDVLFSLKDDVSAKFMKSYLYILFLLLPAAVLADFSCVNENVSIKASTDHLEDKGDGTIFDPKTGLVWMKCVAGQIWSSSSNDCIGEPLQSNWGFAFELVQGVNDGIWGQNFGKTDWRIPNVKEFESIAESRCWYPALNTAVFTNVPENYGVKGGFYWTSTIASENENVDARAYYYGLTVGNVILGDKTFKQYFRFVRGGD